MDLLVSLPAFLLAVLLIAAAPGPGMALLLRRAALRGFRGAVPTVLGLELGLYLWALAAGAGLAALVAASELAYLALRVGGAAVLLVLGIGAWRAALQARREVAGAAAATRAPPAGAGGTAPGRAGAAWRPAFAEAVLVQLANPKLAVFLLAFYPQFVPADRPLLATTAVLALLQVAVEAALYLGLAAVVGRARAWFRRPAVRCRLEAASGTVLIGLGLRLATTAR